MSNDFIKNLLNLETESDRDDDDVSLDGHFIFQETHEEILDNFFGIRDTENSEIFVGDIRIQETTGETINIIDERSKDTQENEINKNINIKKKKNKSL